MFTYKLRFGSERFPSLHDSYTFRSPERFVIGQTVWGQTSQGLTQAEVVRIDGPTVTALALKARWIPRAYSAPQEKARQKQEARNVH